jgi:hypothetical protein
LKLLFLCLFIEEVLVLGEGLPALVPLALPSFLVFVPVTFFAIIVNLTLFDRSVNLCIISICMIRYQLKCSHDHSFDGWFPNIAEFERQKDKKLIICPMCDSTQVDRDIMSPGINKITKKTKTPKKTKTEEDKIEDLKKELLGKEMMMASRAKDVLREIRKHVVSNFENVGDDFLKEVRKAEKGDRDDKFYGTPSQKEVDKLLEEGIDLFHVPDIKEDA